jgi:hypothetical protein
MATDLLDAREPVLHLAAQVFVRVLQVLVSLGEPEAAGEVQQAVVWER